MFVRFVLYNRPAKESCVGRTSLSMGEFFLIRLNAFNFRFFSHSFGFYHFLSPPSTKVLSKAFFKSAK